MASPRPFNSKKMEKTTRLRSDHSIEAKSPIKLTMTHSSSKGDLTFRNKTDLKTQPQSFTNTTNTNTQQFNSTFDKDNFNINLTQINQNLQINNNRNAQYVSPKQCELIHAIWQISQKLSSYANVHLNDQIYKIQMEIKKMLSMIASENVSSNTPLASSKKIDLQDCMPASNCQKMRESQKQFQDTLSECWAISEAEQSESEPAKNQNHIPFLNQQGTKRNKESERSAKQQLQVKKIMYMLDGKQVPIEMTPSKLDKNSSLSSFNVNSNSDSGYTLLQIQKWSQRSSYFSYKTEPNEAFAQEPSNVMFKKNQRRSQEEVKKTAKKRSTEESQNNTKRQGKKESQQNQDRTANKRKVLNEIVNMLNKKYNKNIKLE